MRRTERAVSRGKVILLLNSVGGFRDLKNYGEKAKAHLRRGVRLLPGFTEHSNPQVGMMV